MYMHAALAIFTLSATLLAEPQGSRVHYGSRPSLDEVGFVFELPSPISRATVSRYATILALAEAQHRYVEFMFDKHLAQVDQIDSEYVGKLKETALDLMQLHGKAEQHLDLLNALHDIRTLESAFCDAMERQEDLFMQQITHILADKQQEQMARVRMHRQRDRYPKKFYALPKAGIDLSEIVEQSNLPSDVMVALEPIMWKYEQAATERFVDAERKYRRAQIRLVELEIIQTFDERGQRRDWSKPGRPGPHTEARHEEVRVRHERAQAAKRIADVNDAFLPQYVAAMPPDLGEMFRVAYMSTAYRFVYPDSTDPAALYRSVVQSAELDDDLRIVAESIWKEYRAGYEQICKLMRDATDERLELFAFQNTNRGWQQHNDRMTLWTEERMSKNAEFVKRLKDLLPSNIADAHAPLFAQWLESLEKQREHMRQNPLINPRHG